MSAIVITEAESTSGSKQMAVIPQQLVYLREAVTTLETELDRLEDKLSPVRLTMPRNEPGEVSPAEPMSNLALQIAEPVAALGELVRRMKHLYDEIEL